MSDAMLNEDNILVDKNGRKLDDSELRNSISNKKYTNDTFYKKLSELYGDALSARGQNVSDPLKAKMFYYDKYQLYGNVDPATTLKSYVFFTRPDLNFSAENILNSPILEYYYNTEIGKMVMTMLTDPESSIGVFSANFYNHSALCRANNEVNRLINQLHKIERMYEDEMNRYQTAKYLSETGSTEDITSLEGAITNNANYVEATNKMKEIMNSNDEEANTDIESELSKIEEQLASASDEIINSAWEAGAITSTYEYYSGLNELNDNEIESEMEGLTDSEKEIMKSVSAGAPSRVGGKAGRKRNNANANKDGIASRIQYLKDYADKIASIELKGDVLQLDPGMVRAGDLKLAKDFFYVYDTYQKKNVEANFTSPFIPLLSNCCVSLDGFKDWNLESFTYESDYFGGSLSVATGQDDVFGPGEATVEFEDIYGGPISIMFIIWVDYIMRVSRGVINPTRQNILNHVLDYTSSIYVFNCDRDGSTIRYFGKLTGCFPVSCPLGSFIKFSREPSLENVKNISISFKFNRYEPMAPDVISDFNFLSMQEFALKPAVDYESVFGRHQNLENILKSYGNKSTTNSTSNNVGYMNFINIEIDNCGLSGRVPFPAVPGSLLDNGFNFSEMSNNYWGGYPYIKNGNKLIWVSPRTNPDDVKYRSLFPDYYQ